MLLGSQLTYTPRELGISSLVVTSTPQNGSAFGFDGCNQLTLVYQYTRVAGTTLSFQVQVSYDAGVTWNVVATETLALGAGSIYAQTNSDGDVAASPASVNRHLNYALHTGIGGNVRIGAITCTGGTTDTLTMTAHVAVVC